MTARRALARGLALLLAGGPAMAQVTVAPRIGMRPQQGAPQPPARANFGATLLQLHGDGVPGAGDAETARRITDRVFAESVTPCGSSAITSHRATFLLSSYRDQTVVAVGTYLLEYRGLQTTVTPQEHTAAQSLNGVAMEAQARVTADVVRQYSPPELVRFDNGEQGWQPWRDKAHAAGGLFDHALLELNLVHRNGLWTARRVEGPIDAFHTVDDVGAGGSSGGYDALYLKIRKAVVPEPVPCERKPAEAPGRRP